LVLIGITLKTNKMKSTTSSLNYVRHIFEKILFSSQIIVLSVALPVLYCVGVSREVSTTNKVVIIKTNKGKTIMKLDDDKTTINPFVSSTVER
jgi:hypothetical protein